MLPAIDITVDRNKGTAFISAVFYVEIKKLKFKNPPIGGFLIYNFSITTIAAE